MAARATLILSGWSFGIAWITVLLSSAAEFPIDDVNIGTYVRRAILYNPPHHALGYPPPAEVYNPLTELSPPPGEEVELFPDWVSGYYRHQNSASEFEHRTALSHPCPTIETKSREDIQFAVYPPPANPGFPDDVLMALGIQHELYSALRETSLYLPEPPSPAGTR